MRKLLVLLVALAALAATGVAASSGGIGDRFGGLAHVYGGGEIGPGCFTGGTGICFPDARDFSLDVLGDGRNLAVGSLDYGIPGGPVYVKMRVTCMLVVGNRAEVGGWITDSWRPDQVGMAMVYFVTDNGPVQSPVRDQASLAWIGTPGAPDDFPASFPAKCLPIDGIAGAPAVFQDVRGDVVVQPLG